MKESKKDWFRWTAEKQGYKVIKMVRSLSDCFQNDIFKDEPERVERIFTAIQAELNSARRRFYAEKHYFSLPHPYEKRRDILGSPHLSLPLPDGNILWAVAFQQDDYPGINIYLEQPLDFPELICFAEYNPERSPRYAVCIGAYQSFEDDTKYYQPYVEERKSDE